MLTLVARRCLSWQLCCLVEVKWRNRFLDPQKLESILDNGLDLGAGKPVDQILRVIFNKSEQVHQGVDRVEFVDLVQAVVSNNASVLVTQLRAEL